jgi:hypothetical protein
MLMVMMISGDGNGLVTAWNTRHKHKLWHWVCNFKWTKTNAMAYYWSNVHNTIIASFSELQASRLCQDGNDNHYTKHHCSQLQIDQYIKNQIQWVTANFHVCKTTTTSFNKRCICL